MVDIKKDLLAPCGLYCGVCTIYIAHKNNNMKLKEAIAKSRVYKAYLDKNDDIKCTGCQSENFNDIFGYCRKCKIRDCEKKRDIKLAMNVRTFLVDG